MEHRVIDVHDGSTSEEWLVVYADGRIVLLVVYADGRIVLHTENNGPRILRHGVEPHDESITLEDVVKLDAQHWNKHLVEKVHAALAEMKASR
jgi:hypothetical protein